MMMDDINYLTEKQFKKGMPDDRQKSRLELAQAWMVSLKKF